MPVLPGESRQRAEVQSPRPLSYPDRPTRSVTRRIVVATAAVTAAVGTTVAVSPRWLSLRFARVHDTVVVRVLACLLFAATAGTTTTSVQGRTTFFVFYFVVPVIILFVLFALLAGLLVVCLAAIRAVVVRRACCPVLIIVATIVTVIIVVIATAPALVALLALTLGAACSRVRATIGSYYSVPGSAEARRSNATTVGVARWGGFGRGGTHACSSCCRPPDAVKAAVAGGGAALWPLAVFCCWRHAVLDSIRPIHHHHLWCR